MESISFDRAADYYDRTRSLSPEAMAEMVPLLVDALGGRDRALEIGVGTGRIALPLAESGVSVTGLDLSEPMLRALRAKSSEVPAVLGDATKLPFATDSFPAAVACHVLHLIPNWQDALVELARVVEPGGALLINLGGWDHGVWRAIEERFVAEAGVEKPRVGATDPTEVDAVLGRFGARLRVLPDVVDNRRQSYAELLDRIEDGMYSFTWGTDEATRVRAARAVRDWLTAEHGSLEEVHDKLWIVSWRLYELPG